LMGAAQQQFAGLTFTLGGPVDANHNQARFTWHLGPDGGEPVGIGFDVLVLDSAGRGFSWARGRSAAGSR
jgi:hypothetical protein